jgi:hypothetical protein
MGRAQRTASSGPYESRRGINTNQGEQAARGRRNNLRTSIFRRKSYQYQRTIDLVDKQGNRTSEVQEGRMNITSRDSVLTALEHRANQYRNQGKLGDIGDRSVLAAAAIDETGTVNVSYMLHESENNERLVLIEEQE